MLHQDNVMVTEKPLVVQAALDVVGAPNHGAITTFIGAVRNHNHNKEVIGVTYDVFSALAETVFYTLCEEAHQQWGDDLTIYIAHYRGRLDVGGVSVIIAVGSPHRREACDACRYIIEALKQRAPIWKQEHYVDGNSEWVKGHALCTHT